MDRRSLLKGLFPAVAAIATGTAGATLIKRDNKCVLVVDPARVSMGQAMQLGRSLGLPADTAIVSVYCKEDEYPESAFAVFERGA